MRFWERFMEKIREVASSRGYTCDGCGAEIFHYPVQRLCKDCENDMRRPSKNVCEKCGRQTISEGICLDCKSVLPKFSKGISPFVYRGRTASLVNQIKNGKRRLAYYFGTEMANAFLRVNGLEKDTPLLVVPVPLTERKKKERGYNQAETLARVVTENLRRKGIQAELDTKLLIKTRETAQQKHLGFVSRAENVAGVFHVHKRTACREKTILLVDDIMTTGATGSECATRLYGAGAKEVLFLVAAALPERK